MVARVTSTANLQSNENPFGPSPQAVQARAADSADSACRGPPAPLAWRFRPTFRCECIRSTGSYLPTSPLADRELSPQVQAMMAECANASRYSEDVSVELRSLLAAKEGVAPEQVVHVKSTGLAQTLGQVQASAHDRDFQSNCWANLRMLGRPC
jgi:histidinol-phosphate/aromatic aminotransferase/cobyric acid decarboxylase-like protein